jgi:hypothetical protein
LATLKRQQKGNEEQQFHIQPPSTHKPRVRSVRLDVGNRGYSVLRAERVSEARRIAANVAKLQICCGANTTLNPRGALLDSV